MTTVKSIITSALLAFTIACPQTGLSQNAPRHPYWVSATQVYKFPNTNWAESPGDVEQVIDEDTANYVVIAPDGTRLQLPKALAKPITADEAAAQLILERQKTYAQMLQIKAQMVQFVSYVKAAVAQRQQQQSMSPAEVSQYLNLIQQLEDMGNSVSKQNRYEIQVKQR